MAAATGVLHLMDGLRAHHEAEGRIQNSPVGSPGSFAIASDPQLSAGCLSATPAVAAVLGTPKRSDRYETFEALEVDADDRS